MPKKKFNNWASVGQTYTDANGEEKTLTKDQEIVEFDEATFDKLCADKSFSMPHAEGDIIIIDKDIKFVGRAYIAEDENGVKSLEYSPSIQVKNDHREVVTISMSALRSRIGFDRKECLQGLYSSTTQFTTMKTKLLELANSSVAKAKKTMIYKVVTDGNVIRGCFAPKE